MRAIKMRNNGQCNATEAANNSRASSSNGCGGNAADSETPHHASGHRLRAADPPSAADSLAPDSKNATLTPAQLRCHTSKNNGSSSNYNASSAVSSVGNKTETMDAPVDFEDEDSQCLPGSFDPLADAVARDAPLTFTARDDPRVVARLPLTFRELLPTIDQQLLYRQRQDAHQLAVEEDAVAAAATLTSSTESRVRPGEYPPVSDFLRERLPLAVGRVPGCRTKMVHAVEETDTPTSGAAGGAASRKSNRVAHEEPPTLEEEQRVYREQVSEEVLEYLLSPCLPRRCTPLSDGAADEGQETEGDRDSEQQRRPEEEQRYALVESCLSGLREVPSDSVEYGEILRRLVRVTDTRAASVPQQQEQQEQESQQEFGDSADLEVDLPAYARQLLVGCSASIRGEGKTERSLLLAGAEPRAPVVAATLRAALDAVLPPRMLLYYIVRYETAVELQRQRRAAQAQQEALRQAVQEHPDDRSSQAALEEVTALLSDHYTKAPVGMVLVLLERTSDVQAPREYLNGLERSIDDVLALCHARCCGRPLKLSTSAQNAQRPATITAPAAPSAGSPTPTRPAEERRKNQKGQLKSRAGATTAATTTTILSTVKNPVCTSTTKPLPARPAALTSSGGGSASVATTLHVLELNKQRCLVLFDLLGEEVLRQITVDLPERGILLRRLLDEAQLSLDARAVLARERVHATQEGLRDGQDDREALAAAMATLEVEAAALRERLATLQTRKAGLEAWAEERKVRAAAERDVRLRFEERLRERLTAHTEAMKTAHEVTRQSALA
ncbi:Axonemal dynein light chain [Lotmaria passim]